MAVLSWSRSRPTRQTERCRLLTTARDDFPEAVGLVIAFAEGGFVGALDFWRTTSIDQEHLVTALAAIAVFLAGQTGRATGQSLEQVLQMLWDMEIGGTLELDRPLLGAAEADEVAEGTGRSIVGEG
jgi:hypothetical protein